MDVVADDDDYDYDCNAKCRHACDDGYFDYDVITIVIIIVRMIVMKMMM